MTVATSLWGGNYPLVHSSWVGCNPKLYHPPVLGICSTCSLLLLREKWHPSSHLSAPYSRPFISLIRFKYHFALNLLTVKWCSCYFIAILLVHRREHSHLSTSKSPGPISARKFAKIGTTREGKWADYGLFIEVILWGLCKRKRVTLLVIEEYCTI